MAAEVKTPADVAIRRAFIKLKSFSAEKLAERYALQSL